MTCVPKPRRRDGKEGSLVLVERHYDPVRLNEIVNHPAVFEAACGAVLSCPFDGAVLFERIPGLIVLVGEHGAAMFAPCHWPDWYDAHFAVLPSGRGRWCMAAAQDVLRYMFEDANAGGLIFRVPRGNLAALAGARMLGAEFRIETMPAFQTSNGLVPLLIHHLTRERWLARAGRLN